MTGAQLFLQTSFRFCHFLGQPGIESHAIGACNEVRVIGTVVGNQGTVVLQFFQLFPVHHHAVLFIHRIGIHENGKRPLALFQQWIGVVIHRAIGVIEGNGDGFLRQ